MSDIDERFAKLKSLVLKSIQTSPGTELNELYELLHFIDSLQENIERAYEAQGKIAELQTQLAQLGEPPLQYGIFLGICRGRADAMEEQQNESRRILWDRLDQLLETATERETSANEREKLRAMRQSLEEVRTQVETQRDLVIGIQGQRYEVNLATSDISPAQLKEGQEVVLNKMMNVVGVRDQHARGDTAEVANIISPAGTARVTLVLDDGETIQVQWAGGDKSDKFEVACNSDLRQTLHRGDIVQIDKDEKKAVEKVKPRLHVRSGGSEGIVVEISDRLFEDGVDIGDIVRVDTRLQFAFEKLPSYQTGGLALEDVPDVSFEDIGGLDDQIEEIRDAIELPYLHRRLFDEYQLPRTKGIMLYGPPGCGKTMIAKAIANSLTQSIRSHLKRLQQRIDLYLRLRKNFDDTEALEEYRQFLAQSPASPGQSAMFDQEVQGDRAVAQLAIDLRANDVEPEGAEEALRRVQNVLQRDEGIRSFFLNIKGPELLSKWVGESEHRIRKIFEEAKRSATFYTPVVIFFDEMEAMFRARGSGRSSDVETTIVPQFLSEMDGVESSENVIIIGASNRHDLIDPAIMRPGRLDVKIKVDRPDRSSAMNILALNLTPDLPLRPDGLERPIKADPHAITFKPHIIRRTLQGSEPVLPTDTWDDLLSMMPAHYDVRRVLAENQALTQLYQDQQARAALEEAARREQLAEALITEIVDLFFSPASHLEATTTAGKHHTLPLRDFVSGALLVGVVSRAKKRAVKRRAGQEGTVGGIAFDDMYAALKEEFDESAEQLAANALERELASRAPGQPGDAVQFVEVHLGMAPQDPWSIEKARPYRAQG